jgi:hypothetical protein
MIMRRVLNCLSIICVLVLVSCKREKAEWDTKWALPLVEDSLTLEQLDDQSILSVNSGSYELSIDRNIYSFRLSDFVKIPDTTVRHSFALNVSNFNVAPGVSFVNDIQEHNFDLDPVQLRLMQIQTGGIQLRVESPVETSTIFTVELPGVIKNGITLTQSFTVPPGTNANPSSISDYVDLTGYSIDLTGQNGNSSNKLQSILTVKTDPNGPSVTINNQDSLRFDFTMNNLKLDYARGYFGSELITETVVENISFFNNIVSGMVDIDAASLGLEIENGFKLSAKIKLVSLKNTNYEGNMVSLVHPSVGDWITINPAFGNYNAFQSTITNLAFDGTNSNLENYLENHGGSNEISYQLQINPWGNISGGYDEIYDAHPLNIKLTGNLPLNIGFDDLTIVDTFDFSLNQNYDATHVESGIIWLNVTNAFPFQGDLELFFLDGSGNLLTQLISDNSVASSVYGTVINGILQKDSKVNLNCTTEQVALLNNAKKVCMRLKLNTPDPNTNNSIQMSIPEGAFMKFKLGAKIAVKHKV